MPDNTLFFSADRYDVQSLYRTISRQSKLGTIRVHDAEGGYLVSFSDCPISIRQAQKQFQRHLNDLIENR